MRMCWWVIIFHSQRNLNICSIYKEGGGGYNSIQKARRGDRAIHNAEDMKMAAEKKAEIEPADFDKIELRVGKVLSCERHPAADKLFVLKVDLGQGDVRQIVSGLAQSYTPGQVMGKNVVVITNLKPAVIRGIESKGMLLAGKDERQIAVVEVNGLEPGTRIS